jgi:hypothetical protein
LKSLSGLCIFWQFPRSMDNWRLSEAIRETITANRRFPGVICPHDYQISRNGIDSGLKVSGKVFPAEFWLFSPRVATDLALPR